MVKMITANKARAKTEFARSVGAHVGWFNQQIESHTKRGDDGMTIVKPKDMNIGQWELFVDTIISAGYRVVELKADRIEVYW